MLPEAETIVQGVHLGAVVIGFLVLHRAAQQHSPLQAKAKWALFLSGMLLVGVGLLLGLSLLGLSTERSVPDTLLLKYFGFPTGAVCLGYSLVIVSVVSLFQSKEPS